MQAGPGVLPVKQWTAGEPPADYLITGFSLNNRPAGDRAKPALAAQKLSFIEKMTSLMEKRADWNYIRRWLGQAVPEAGWNQLAERIHPIVARFGLRASGFRAGCDHLF